VDFDAVRAQAARLSPWCHVATVTPQGTPHVVPVHPAFDLDGGGGGPTIWAMVGVGSVKARNVRANPEVMLHWQVTEAGDNLMVWGRATVHDDLATKQRLWEGVFDYDLNLFAPGGPEGSPETAFLAVAPARAVFSEFYGIKGRQEWRAA
jgi:general stress protein 26